jgi:hypothetical protein
MSISTILRTCAAVYIAVIILELALSRRVKRFVAELLVLVCLVILDALITNAVVGHVAFGEGTSPRAVVLVMFISVVLGIAAPAFLNAF